MRLKHGVKIFRCRCGRPNVGLQAGEKRSEDGTEKSDLLIRDLVENGDEGSDSFEEVELRVEKGRGGSGFGEDGVGGWFVRGELGGDVEEIL